MTNEAKQKDLSAEVEELQRLLSAVEAFSRGLIELMQQPVLLTPHPVEPWPFVPFPVHPQWAKAWKDYAAAWEQRWELDPAAADVAWPKEIAVPGWEHLVIRKHPWRRQL